jgi:sulfur carrier protein ThiS
VRVEVILYGELRRYAAGERVKLDLPDGATLDGVFERLGLSAGEPWWISAVNDTVVEPDHQLADGDLVELFHPVGGG